MNLHDILFVMTAISIFTNGFYFRKKSMIGLLISALLGQIPFWFDVTSMGISKYSQGLINSDTYSWAMAITIAVFIWVMGYIAGGINLKKGDKTDDFPVSDDKYMKFDIDDNE